MREGEGGRGVEKGGGGKKGGVREVRGRRELERVAGWGPEGFFLFLFFFRWGRVPGDRERWEMGRGRGRGIKWVWEYGE